MLGVVSPLPEGYTYENVRFIHQGVRMNIAHKGAIIAEVEQIMQDVQEFDVPVKMRYMARAIDYDSRMMRPFNSLHPWVTYPDMETLVSAVLARHRIGVKA